MAPIWGTFILEVFARPEAREVRDALEELLGPQSCSAFSTGGVYVFWDPETREPLYVGIAGDLPLRFAQHLGLRSAPAKGCRREQIGAYFAPAMSVSATRSSSCRGSVRPRPRGSEPPWRSKTAT